MDGRDIGTHVMPDAEIKVFLDSECEGTSRASIQRDAKQWDLQHLRSPNLNRTLLVAINWMSRERFHRFDRAHDAVLMDSTSMTIEEVVDEILGLCKDKVGGGK